MLKKVACNFVYSTNIQHISGAYNKLKNMLRNKGTKIFSEIASFFTSDEKAVRKIIELYQSMGISSMHIGVQDCKQGFFRKMDILLALLLSPIANTGQLRNNPTAYWIKQSLNAEKDVLYRFINNCHLRWRSIVYEINCKLIKCMNVANPSNACLILDDTDLKKTGFAMELVSRVWSHVDNKAVLGFKGLFMGWCDGKSFLAMDFSVHREKGKNEKTPFGLKPHQLKKQYKKNRPANSAGAKRVQEADQKKTDTGMSMIRRALRLKIPFGYVLVDSWFMSGKMIRFILSLPGKKHLLGMGKMNSTKYTFQDKEFTAKELCDRLSRKKKGKRNRSLHMTCIQVNVYLQELPVCLYFYRNTGKGPWQFVNSTNLDLSPLEAYQLYAIRWNIEVYFKESKEFFGLNDCHSRDFDALVAHTSVAMIAYNMFSTAKRLNHYETLGDLFREVASQMTELSLSDRIWAVIEELLKWVSEYLDINFESFIQSLMQKGDPDSKLLRIISYANARAA